MEDDEAAGGAPGGTDAAASVWNGSAAAIVAGTAVGPGVGSAPSWGALNNGNVVPAPPAAATVAGGMWPTGGNTPAITTAGAPSAGSMNNPQMAAIGVKKDLNEWGAGGGVGQVGAVGSGSIGVPGGPAQGGWGADARAAAGVTGALPSVGGGANVNGPTAGGFNIGSTLGAAADGLRGDPRGISGRLNGAAAGSMWGA